MNFTQFQNQEFSQFVKLSNCSAKEAWKRAYQIARLEKGGYLDNMDETIVTIKGIEYCLQVYTPCPSATVLILAENVLCQREQKRHAMPGVILHAQKELRQENPFSGWLPPDTASEAVRRARGFWWWWLAERGQGTSGMFRRDRSRSVRGECSLNF
jgi:hypothetical protein